MSYFRALGKFVEGSGIEHVWISSGVLSRGSVNGVLTGKMLTYLALRRLVLKTLKSDDHENVEYEAFVVVIEQNLKGIEGPTAKFWTMYTKFVKTFLLCAR